MCAGLRKPVSSPGVITFFQILQEVNISLGKILDMHIVPYVLSLPDYRSLQHFDSAEDTFVQ